MTTNEAINLYAAIQDLRNGKMGESLYPYALVRLELKKVYEAFKQAEAEFVEQTRPADYKPGDDVTQWNKVVTGMNNKWAAEQPDVEINKCLSFEDAVTLCNHNDVAGSLQDEVIRLLVNFKIDIK